MKDNGTDGGGLRYLRSLPYRVPTTASRKSDPSGIPEWSSSFFRRIALALVVVLSLMLDSAQAGVSLSTSDPAAGPLIMSAGSVSGPMDLIVTSDNPPNDNMAAWTVQLEILPIAASGTLDFDAPATGTPSDPPDYVFGADGLGIAATDSGTVLSANDFLDPAIGTAVSVPGVPGANLLLMTFSASSSAAGRFGIYAEEGAALTNWTDTNLATQFFTNVPGGSSTVLIGEVQIPSSAAVPEPSTLGLLALSGLLLRASRRRRHHGPPLAR